MEFPLVNIHTHRPAGQGIEPQGIGIHPWDVDRLSGPELENALRDVENAKSCIIGEIGLDFATATGDRERQKMVFAAQLRIAVERDLPVVLHCVRAFEPVMDILSGYKLRAVVFHCFVGSVEQARRAINSGYFLSFGERSFASPKTVEAMLSVPLTQIFLETDDSPTPISEIYARASEILNVPVAQLSEQLYYNYERVVVAH